MGNRRRVKASSVAALYDIHGNLPALEAVLAEVPAEATILVGGDVALGGFPEQTLELLRSLGERVLWVRGNCDRELTPGEHGFVSEHALEWVRSQLSDQQIAFLHGLPTEVELEIEGLGRVLFCHASPRNDIDIFIARTPEAHVAPLFAGVSADLVVVGHNHVQFERTVGGIRVVNAGSVGLAYEDEPGAYWALIGPEVEHRRTQFEPRPSTFPGWAAPRQTRAEYLARAERLAVRG
jgi:putative phosphoesterase